MATNPLLGTMMLVLLCCGASAAFAQEAPREQRAKGVGNAPPAIAITSGLFVTVPNHDEVLGAFTVINNDHVAHLMTGFSSPACGELRMEQWDGSPVNAGPLELTVPAKGKMVFLRGGYHLHCERPTHPLNVGDMVEVSVNFEQLPPTKATFQVRPITTPGVASG